MKQLQKTQSKFNEYIRLRDKDQVCISCGRSKIEHAGHYYPAGKYSSVRFNEDNVHGQCVSCNYFQHGNLIKYRVFLERRIGKDRLNLLDSEATRKIHKWSQTELIQIYEIYKAKIKDKRSKL